MQEPKSKRNSRLSGRILPYAAMSILISIIGVMTESAFSATKPFNYLTYYQVSIAVFLLRLVPALLQVFLIERFLKQSIRGWFASTALGTLISLLILGTITSWPSNLEIIQITGLLTVYGPQMVLQGLWLQRRVKKAWLWPLSIIFAQYMLPSVFMRFDNLLVISTLFAVHPVVAALIQAMTLYFLLSHPRETEKAKIDHSADTRADENARIERLQEVDHSTPLWNSGDEQALQSEA